MTTVRHRLVLLAAFTLVLVALMSCTSSNSERGSSKPRIALLLPESKTTRYETQDRPQFEAAVHERCPECEVLYSNADQDAAKQLDQADAALTNGADVLVLDPVDSASAVSIVTKARDQEVPVVSYDRLVLDAPVDAYVSFDNERVGELQATALVDRIRKLNLAGSIVMINGAPTDHNAADFKRGAHKILDAGGISIGAEYDTPDWSPDKAQQQMEQAITRLGHDRIAGVYAANDGMASGAIAAMRSAGFTPLPPVTGMDAELAAIQSVLDGAQYMTVYKAVKSEAQHAAEIAVGLLRGQRPATTQSIDNGTKQIPAVLLAPVAVTAENVKTTVIADDFWTSAQICTAGLQSACHAAGLT